MRRPLITSTFLAYLVVAANFASAATIFTAAIDNNLLNAANWDNGLPGPGNDGTVSINAGYTGLNQGADFTNGGVVTVDSGATLSLANDLAISGGTLIVNDATINASDDIFVQGNLTLNAGSVTTAIDDWEVNVAAGVVTINGGTHSAGDFFGTQAAAGTLNILGGKVIAGQSRFSSNSFVTIGGDATFMITGSHFTSTTPGGLDFLSSWTGSFTAGSLSGAGSSWEAALIAEYTFDGSPITQAIFDQNFVVSSDGLTLSRVPEPSGGVLLVAAGGLLLVLRRRR